jgi:hypothetical protein
MPALGHTSMAMLHQRFLAKSAELFKHHLVVFATRTHLLSAGMKFRKVFRGHVLAASTSLSHDTSSYEQCNASLCLQQSYSTANAKTFL